MVNSYLFKECQSPPGRVVNFRWMKRAQGVLTRLTEIDEGYEHGAVPLTWGIYYLPLPKAVGGDMAASAANLERAIAIGPTSLLNRWGRAKYSFEKTGNRAGFVADMSWGLEQDPRHASSP